MKNAIIYITTFVVGAAAGSLVTYKLLNKKYQRDFEQEVADVREAYTKKLVDAYNTFDEDEKLEPLPPKKQKSTFVKPEFHDYTKHAKEADPSVIAKKPELSSLVREMGEEATKPVTDETTIYVISEDEFVMNVGDYEKIELEYFVDDDGLVDDKNDLIEREDRSRFIGDIDLLNFEQYKDEEDSGSIFVCNKNLEVLFEILLNPSSYSKEILGIDYDEMDDERPKRETIRKPRKLEG